MTVASTSDTKKRVPMKVAPASPPIPDTGPAQVAPEFPPEIMEALRQAPPGTMIQGQGGEKFIWDGQNLNPAE